jgi:probable HAF family extracellular repeat protein
MVVSLIASAGWSQQASLTWLGTLGGAESFAYGVSADGSVVVGYSRNAAGRLHAVRWANGVIQDLGTLGGDEGRAWSVSADGQVVVGVSRTVAGREHAFRWANGVMQDFGARGGDRSAAVGVSADGSVVVGAYQPRGDWLERAFRWTVAGGMEDLNITYASLLTPGWLLAGALAISPDGRYIVGVGFNADTWRTEAYLLDTGFPLRGDVDRNGCVDDADLLRVLFAFGGRGYRNEDLNWDGIIDDADLLIVLFNFGSEC